LDEDGCGRKKGKMSNIFRANGLERVQRQAVAIVVFIAGGLSFVAATAGWASAQEILPRPERVPAPVVGRVPEESQPPTQWPTAPVAPHGAPNILVVLTDDVGYGASSTFGGPIPTPTFDAVAKVGLRYTEFHTNAICSPTRASLLTGRNEHEVGFGRLVEAANAYEGYTTVIPKSAATIAEILKDNGYSTGAFGKYHNVPDWETSAVGPFDHWPTYMGFQYFYGFLGGETNQWAPALIQGTTPIEPPHDDPSYHFERDLADHAINWIHQQKSIAPDKPIFLYYATGAAHSPHQVPKDWIAKFKGQFDQGWDKVREETLERQKKLGVVPQGTQLTARPKEIPAWDSLSPERKQVYARMMEVYAATLAHSDHQIGRVIDALRETGQLDNTLIIYIQGDNGASGEGGLAGSLNETAGMLNFLDEDFENVRKHLDDLGGPMAYNHYPVGWAHAMNAPFQWFKQVASHFGATRNGMVISWPARIKDQGGIRPQFHHVIDIAPTILEVTGLPAPVMVNGVAQKPMSGVSMAYTFDNAAAPSTRITQYFEQFGNRAIYHDGWVAAAGPVELPWEMTNKKKIDDIKWELYHISDDYSEAVDLAAKEPQRLHDLENLFWAEAARNHALPILLGKFHMEGPPRPSLTLGRKSFVYYSGVDRLPPSSSPNLLNKSYTILADVVIPEGGANGVLFAQGGRFGGHSLYLLDGRLTYHYNTMGEVRLTVSSPAKLSAGKHVLGVQFKYDGGGMGKGGAVTLLLDGTPVGSGRVERTPPFAMSYGEGVDIGRDTATPVSEDYSTPFAFTGTLNKVTVTLD
jgi:arylsulfatase